MKIKSLLFVIAIILLQWSCKKDTETNNFKFTSISGAKSGTSGIVTFMWSDNQNSNWNVVIKNQDGAIRSSFNVTEDLAQVASLGLDSTYTFGVNGGGKPSQNGTFNARIATTGDVLITNIKP